MENSEEGSGYCQGHNATGQIFMWKRVKSGLIIHQSLRSSDTTRDKHGGDVRVCARTRLREEVIRCGGQRGAEGRAAVVGNW